MVVRVGYLRAMAVAVGYLLSEAVIWTHHSLPMIGHAR